MLDLVTGELSAVQILIYGMRRTVPRLACIEFPYVSLFQDNWNDFGWRVRFVASLHISEVEEIDLGAVRISSGGQEFRADTLPIIIDKLPRSSASLGESIAYYRRLGKIPRPLRRPYLMLMQDIVAQPSRRNRIGDGPLWEKSFMREASSRHAYQRGGYYIGAPHERVEPPNFNFKMQLPNTPSAHSIDINYAEHNGLPSRTVVWVGRNGTGKTRALAALAAGLMPQQVFSKLSIRNLPEVDLSPAITISRLITISYNVFDEFPLPRPASEKSPRIGGAAYKSRASYKYCGLRNDEGVVNTDEVEAMLGQALGPVARSDRTDILSDVLTTLLGSAIAEDLVSDDADARTSALRNLSAGQRLVAAIFSNIIGFIEEGSLLLIDEPETNLHPGMLSTFMAALNATLDEFDSYAIVATHSPIVLQQVPSRYVRQFTRDSTNKPSIKKLKFECFGEDLGEITRRVLDLADPEQDFTDVLDRLFAMHGSAEEVAALFQYPLGIPAMAHLYSLEENYDAEDDR